MNLKVITSQNATECDLHHFVTEASSLMLSPGQIPHELETTIGNSQPFRIVRVDPDGSAHYHQLLGCTRLTILND